MNVIYSDQDIEKLLKLHIPSLFLAGPTPRSKEVPSWRPIAVEFLEMLNYKGQVLVPERSIKNGVKFDYTDQVEWEHYGLENATKIVFWIPRDLKTMPALTTNVEFGRYVSSGRSLYGRPDDAEKCRYLDWLYQKYNRHPVFNSLRQLLVHAL